MGRCAGAIVGADAPLIGAEPAWSSLAACPTSGTRSAACDTSSAIMINQSPPSIGTAVKSPRFNPL